MHLTSSPLDWYAARAGGVIAYLLLSTAVVLGLTMSGKRSLKLWPKFAIEDVHRFLGILTGTFIVLHIVTIAIDSFLPFSFWSLIIPGISKYRPLWVALGIVAAELLLALAFANHYRDKGLAYKTWRRTHYLNFAVWSAATLHGLGSGTDRSSAWMLTMYAVAVAAVVASIAWRVLRRFESPAWLTRVAPTTAAIACVGVVGMIGLTALRFQPKPWNNPTFTDALHGRIQQNAGPTRGIISLAGNGDGTQKVLVRADLLFAPGQLLNTSFQMEYLPSGARCVGQVTTVHNYGFDASCTMPGKTKTTRAITASWRPANSPVIVGGVLRVQGG